MEDQPAAGRRGFTAALAVRPAIVETPLGWTLLVDTLSAGRP